MDNVFNFSIRIYCLLYSVKEKNSLWKFYPCNILWNALRIQADKRNDTNSQNNFNKNVIKERKIFFFTSLSLSSKKITLFIFSFPWNKSESTLFLVAKNFTFDDKFTISLVSESSEKFHGHNLGTTTISPRAIINSGPVLWLHLFGRANFCLLPPRGSISPIQPWSK